MTTKDQAIAAIIEANDKARSFGLLTGTSNWAGVIASALQQPAQPGCRTCNNYHHYRCEFVRNSELACTNGDQYEAAPAVVLWRTE